MAKPPIRVLVVDDYEPFRRFITSTLEQQPELQIIGEATNGLEAVRKAAELNPDLILLDIGLPTLNGIEAARRIREHSSKSQILFCSENRSWDIVEEALRAGALGYVAKSDAARDLLTAVRALLLGKQFVSSSVSGRHGNHPAGEHTGYPASRTSDTPPLYEGEIVGRHDVMFYSDDQQLLDGLSQFIGAALKARNAAIVVATESHRESLVQRLQAQGVDIAAAVEQGRYIALDAAATVSSIMVDGVIESDRSLETCGKIILKAANAARGEHPCVALFGEGADLLWKQGNLDAAIQDEKLCNQLTKRFDVDILCGYSLGKAKVVEDEEIVQQICAEHLAVYRP